MHVRGAEGFHVVQMSIWALKTGDEEGGRDLCGWTREGTTTWDEITRERQMHYTQEKDTHTPSHLVKFVDLISFHLSCDRASGGVVRGKSVKVKTVNTSIFRATGQVMRWCMGKTQR